MHLIEILLPLLDKDGAGFPAKSYERLAREITERFGGFTSFSRSPGARTMAQERRNRA